MSGKHTLSVLFLVTGALARHVVKYKELGPAKLPCYIKEGFHFCYIRPLYNKVLLYATLFCLTGSGTNLKKNVSP